MFRSWHGQYTAKKRRRSRSAKAKINLTISPLDGSEGAAATKTLQNDLMLSGYFTLGGNAAYTARGSASGGTLQGQVVDHSGGTVLSKSYLLGTVTSQKQGSRRRGQD